MKDHQILSNDSATKLYMFNLENRYSKQSDLQNAKINVYKHKIKNKNPVIGFYNRDSKKLIKVNSQKKLKF